MLLHVVEDNQLLGEAYEFMLRANGFDVVLYSCGQKYLDATHNEGDSAVILDLCLPDMSGLDVLSEIRQRTPDLPVIVVTSMGDVSSAVRAMKLGAVDFLEKPVNETDLVALLKDLPLAQQASAAPTGCEQLASLTKREYEILSHIARGLSSKEIGKLLGISPATVDVHRNRILHKLSVRSTPQAISLFLNFEIHIK